MGVYCFSYFSYFSFSYFSYLVRCEVVAQLGMDNLPANAAFFSSVDIDTVMRKEPSADCVTPR